MTKHVNVFQQNRAPSRIILPKGKKSVVSLLSRGIFFTDSNYRTSPPPRPSRFGSRAQSMKNAPLPTSSAAVDLHVSPKGTNSFPGRFLLHKQGGIKKWPEKT